MVILRLQRLAKNRPGSPCYRNYLSYNTEYTEIPICTSSRQYQHYKIKELKEQRDLAVLALQSESEFEKSQQAQIINGFLHNSIFDHRVHRFNVQRDHGDIILPKVQFLQIVFEVQCQTHVHHYPQLTYLSYNQ